MVEKSGFIKLIDMGTAKILPKKNSRTFTMLGTPHYMAPEILTGKGDYLINLMFLKDIQLARIISLLES